MPDAFLSSRERGNAVLTAQGPELEGREEVACGM